MSGRTKKTALNAVANIFYLMASGVCGLIVVRFLLANMGSDYNGLNAAAAQLMTALSIVSTSFTTASLVSLYKPYNDNDWLMLNLVMSTSRTSYRKIGFGVLAIGVVAVTAMSFVIRTEIGQTVVLSVLMMALISTVFNIAVVNVYRLIFQVTQSEYIVTMVSSFYIVVVSIVACILITYTHDIVLIRLSYVILEMLSGVVIAVVARKKYKHLSFSKNIDNSLITGTKDVVVASITGMIYRTAPTLYASAFLGTAATSVYYVYDSVISLARNISQVFVSSPKNALGQVIHGEDSPRLNKVFEEFEYVAIATLTFVMSVVGALILPFMIMYTQGVNDANYIDVSIPIILIVVAFVEVSHIPSGLLIELSGRFKLAKKIQYAAMALLAILMVVLGYFFGLSGMLLSVLGAACLLTVLEVRFSRKEVLAVSNSGFVKLFFSHLLLLAFLAIAEGMACLALVSGIVTFIGALIVVGVLNLVIVGLFGFIFYRGCFRALRERVAVLVEHI